MAISSDVHVAKGPSDDRAYAKAMIDEMPPGTTLGEIEYRVGVAALLRDRSKKVDEILALGVEEATRRGLLLTSEQIQSSIRSWRRR